MAHGDAEASGGRLALTPADASRLAGLLAPLRKVADAIETAVQAHVRAHGPVRLSDGREYGPVIETVTSYRTAPTFDALAAVVGEARANEAFEATGASLKRALDGQPRGAWRALKAELETRGAVVVTAREVWRKRWPAMPVEGGEHDVIGTGDGTGPHGGDAGRDEHLSSEGDEVAHALSGDGGGRAAGRNGGQAGGVTHGRAPMATGAGGVGVPPWMRDAAPTARDDRVEAPGPSGPAPDVGAGRPALPRAAMGLCSVCGREYSLTKDGMRAHPVRGGGPYCDGSGKPPAAL